MIVTSTSNSPSSGLPPGPLTPPTTPNYYPTKPKIGYCNVQYNNNYGRYNVRRIFSIRPPETLLNLLKAGFSNKIVFKIVSVRGHVNCSTEHFGFVTGRKTYCGTINDRNHRPSHQTQSSDYAESRFFVKEFYFFLPANTFLKFFFVYKFRRANHQLLFYTPNLPSPCTFVAVNFY